MPVNVGRKQTPHQMLRRLKREIEASSIRRVAAQYDVSHAFIAEVARGRAPISDRLARQMGYRRDYIYIPVAPESEA